MPLLKINDILTARFVYMFSHQTNEYLIGHQSIQVLHSRFFIPWRMQPDSEMSQAISIHTSEVQRQFLHDVIRPLWEILFSFYNRTFRQHDWQVSPAAAGLGQEDHHAATTAATPRALSAIAAAHAGDTTRGYPANSTATSHCSDAACGLRGLGRPYTPCRPPHWGRRAQVSASQVLCFSVLCEYIRFQS